MSFSKLNVLVALLFTICIFSACKDDCDDIVCQNGGTCDNGICDCPTGFFGDNCESITDPCANVLCEPHQICDNGECICNDDLANAFNTGVFVINEGNFLAGNSSLSYYNEAECITNKNNLYNDVNSEALGDVFQSMTSFEDQYLLVVNNSGRIVAIDNADLTKENEINNLGAPSHLMATANASGEFYLSDLFSNYLYVFDANNFLITDSIELGGGSGPMLKAGDKLFVTNIFGDKLFVYNETTEAVNTVQLTAGVNSIVKSADNNSVWVLCSGDYYIPGSAKLHKIDSNSEAIEETIDITFGSPSRLKLDDFNGDLYWLNGGVYKLNEYGNVAPNDPTIPADGKNFYGLEVQGFEGNIWLADAKDFSQNGDMLRYDLDGNLVDSFTVGIIPNGFYINQ